MGFLIPTLFGDTVFFTQISRSFPTVPKRPHFSADRQLSLVPGACRCLLPAGQGTPCRYQQGRAQVRPKMPQAPQLIP